MPEIEVKVDPPSKEITEAVQKDFPDVEIAQFSNSRSGRFARWIQSLEPRKKYLPVVLASALVSLAVSGFLLSSPPYFVGVFGLVPTTTQLVSLYYLYNEQTTKAKRWCTTSDTLSVTGIVMTILTAWSYFFTDGFGIAFFAREGSILFLFVSLITGTSLNRLYYHHTMTPPDLRAKRKRLYDLESPKELLPGEKVYHVWNRTAFQCCCFPAAIDTLVITTRRVMAYTTRLFDTQPTSFYMSSLDGIESFNIQPPFVCGGCFSLEISMPYDCIIWPCAPVSIVSFSNHTTDVMKGKIHTEYGTDVTRIFLGAKKLAREEDIENKYGMLFDTSLEKYAGKRGNDREKEDDRRRGGMKEGRKVINDDNARGPLLHSKYQSYQGQ